MNSTECIEKLEDIFNNIIQFYKSAKNAKLVPFIKMKPRLVKKEV